MVKSLNLNHLAIFHAVAAEGSMSKGAERLFISQPAVSKQIKELERSLGIRLLDRLPTGVSLTEAGVVLAGHARRLFAVEADAERAISELKDLSTGKLTVGASLTIGVYLLPEILGLFRKRHPGIELHLEIGNTHVIQQKLMENALDIALTEGFVEDPELEAEVFTHDNLVAIVPPLHPLLELKNVSAKRFCAELLLVREQGSGTLEVIERALADKQIAIRSAMSLGSTEAIKRGVIAGLGVAVISQLALRSETEAGTLKVVPIVDLSISRPLHVVRLRGKFESRAVREFRSILREQIP